MFTGIVEGLGRVKAVSPKGNGLVFAIEPNFELDDPREGESIAVNGVCLTALGVSSGMFSADVSPETLSRSNLGDLRPGDMVNLERAVRFSDRLGGHLVSGHIDGVGRVIEKRSIGGFVIFTVAVPNGFDRYIIEKGSIAVDGVSLTVNGCSNGVFSVSVIPHTARITTLGRRRTGEKVNIELDLVGKYIEKLLVPVDRDRDKKGGAGLDQAFLARYGFI
ncbi:MAG: riboflavin synthase [Dissulfurimicrobium sp.]|uniref:riboflavin synthase n=1 Tax=Dissulfurimicrobium TaxID=1769732 RepID=UPI001EDBDBF1|nr:riboflavin synthase [Dissulfurimicrobium hydrothermale]UKL12844.1 riboflavin synthase [Dissulfurimicrobium hydrothermale]